MLFEHNAFLLECSISVGIRSSPIGMTIISIRKWEYSDKKIRKFQSEYAMSHNSEPIIKYVVINIYVYIFLYTYISTKKKCVFFYFFSPFWSKLNEPTITTIIWCKPWKCRQIKSISTLMDTIIAWSRYLAPTGKLLVRSQLNN